jgi:hypothetical protein
MLALACAQGAKDSATAEIDPCEVGAPPSLSIGTGEFSFEELDAIDPELELVHGPQGGFHVVIGLSAQHLDASAKLVAEMTGTVNGLELARTSPYLTFRCNGAAGAQQSWGSLLIFDAMPEDLDDQQVEVAVQLTDQSGQTVSASTAARICDPTLD